MAKSEGLKSSEIGGSSPVKSQHPPGGFSRPWMNQWSVGDTGEPGGASAMNSKCRLCVGRMPPAPLKSHRTLFNVRVPVHPVGATIFVGSTRTPFGTGIAISRVRYALLLSDVFVA